MKWLRSFSSAWLALAITGCTSGIKPGPDAGHCEGLERCACRADKTCNAGLLCLSEICVRPGDSGPSSLAGIPAAGAGASGGSESGLAGAIAGTSGAGALGGAGGSSTGGLAGAIPGTTVAGAPGGMAGGSGGNLGGVDAGVSSVAGSGGRLGAAGSGASDARAGGGNLGNPDAIFEWDAGVLWRPDAAASAPAGGVTFRNGKAEGALSGYGWVALGAQDTLASPTCAGTAMTSSTLCTSDQVVWDRPDALCITGSVPRVKDSAEYATNWGVQIGVNATESPGVGLGNSYSTVTFTYSGTITPSGASVRAVIHRATDNATVYCANIRSGVAIKLTSFNSACWDNSGAFLNEADVPTIDRVGLLVPSNSADSYSVSGLCLSSIVFDAGTTVTPDAALPSKVMVKPATLFFTSTIVGDISPPQTVTVTVGNGPVAITPTVTGDGFMIDSTTCSGSVMQSCVIAVKFAPSTAGAVNGVLNITPTVAVALTGQGVPSPEFTAYSSAIPATVLVNASVPIAVTVSSAQLTDLVCQPSGADLSVDRVKTTCASTLTPGVSCVYAFIFKSASAGTANDAIVCNSPMSGAYKTIPVTPVVVTPARLVSAPSTAAFYAVVGSTASVTLTVVNAGGSPSGIPGTPTITGVNSADFSIKTNSCLFALDAKDSCEIEVTFTPSAAGAKTATLSICDLQSGAVSLTATLTGTAVTGPEPRIQGPSSIGTVTVGTISAPVAYTVTNAGGTASGVLSISVSDAQFSIVNDTCSGFPLTPAASCTFKVIFTPTVAGVSATLLSVTDAGTLQATLPIAGTAAPPASSH